MEQPRSEEQVMAALWACEPRRHPARRSPRTCRPQCRWADSTLLNFLLRLEKRSSSAPKSRGNKNSLHAAGAPPDLLRRGQSGPICRRLLRRRPSRHGAGAGRHRPHELRRHRAASALADRISGRQPGVRLRIAAPGGRQIPASPPYLSRTAWAHGSSGLFVAALLDGQRLKNRFQSACQSNSPRHRGGFVMFHGQVLHPAALAHQRRAVGGVKDQKIPSSGRRLQNVRAAAAAPDALGG